MSETIARCGGPTAVPPAELASSFETLLPR